MDQNIPKPIEQSVTRFVQEATRLYPIRQAYLFGSHVAGKAQPWSDIDLALISEDFVEDTFEDAVRLSVLASKVDSRLEIHLFTPKQCGLDSALFQQVVRSGVKLQLQPTHPSP